MKRLYMLSAAAAAGVALFGGVEISKSGGGVPFVDPLTIARSACGKDAAAILKRRAYFASIGAAWAASEGDAGGPAAHAITPAAGAAYEISTKNPEAQRLFNIGLAHMWNFNHGAAIDAFKAAQAADPDCAMCYWGEAFALGPNINAPMVDDAVPPAYAATESAMARRAQANEKERALIEALTPRYSKKPLKDRSALDEAFAAAMENVAEKFADDDFIVALAVEANMDTQRWDYWQADGRTPKGRAQKSVEMLEKILARSPNHQAAIHLYIHMTEASDNPFRAAAYADRLAALSPGLGHLMHMPSHTWSRIGRWRQAIDENVKAAEADEAFLAGGRASPMYEFGYYVHNVHFVLWSAQLAGDAETALAMAKKLDAKLPYEMAAAVPIAQPIKAAPFYAFAQFGAPADVLALEAPGDEFPFLKGSWHYARGEALAKSGDVAGARAEADAIGKIIDTADMRGLVDNLIPAPDILKIGRLTILARAAAAEGDYVRAAKKMEEAVALQKRLNYTEPAYWYYPAKQTLAAMVLKTGDAERAEQLFVESLGEWPNNGWAYYGLTEAYKAQKDKGARKYAEGMMKAAWLGKEKPTLDRL
jgi:tetratricopeptide (TPR) repeat protein